MELKKIIFEKKRLRICVATRFLQTQFLKKGKKSKAQRIWFECLARIKASTRKTEVTKSPLCSLLSELSPQLDIKKVRVGRSSLEIPCPLRKKRRLFLCLSWLIHDLKKEKKFISISESLANKLTDPRTLTGGLLKKKEWQSLAKKNLRFLRYRWS